MGLSSSCQTVSSSLEWACKYKLGIKYMLHVLDNFLFINTNTANCLKYLNSSTKHVQGRILLASNKTVSPAQALTL